MTERKQGLRTIHHEGNEDQSENTTLDADLELS
jgi:hypothetical protein